MHYLYERIKETISLYDAGKPSAANKTAHETLVLTCHEGLKDSGQAYGNLFSQVDFLCRRHHVRQADRMAVQAMRCHTNRSEPVERDDFMYDMRALCRFVSAVTGADMPAEVLMLLPANDKPYQRAEGLDVRYIRCIVREWTGSLVIVAAEGGISGRLLAVDCSGEEHSYMLKMLREGMQLNLLDCKMSATTAAESNLPEDVNDVVVPGLIVVEPDYLLDISSLAACFREYGHHPLNYTIDRMRPRSNSQAILLGHLAGGVLDGVVNDGRDFSLTDTLRSNFTDNALEYSSCPDFNPDRLMADINVQAENIRKAADVMFEDNGQSRAVLEPSFVCERLGLQGRVDMMTTDFRLLVEQKSGRNRFIENDGRGSRGNRQLEPHYVQLLLYYGVLKYNFNLGYDRTDIRLLYSKYPPEDGLLAVAFYQKLFREAIKLRNKIVATDFIIARDGFGRILPHLTPATVNTAGTDNSFYHTWLLPQILAVTEPLTNLRPLEKEYFCSMMTFAYRETLLGKTGSQEGVSNCTADLWNMPLSEKTETGNIYTGLRITAKEGTEDGGSPCKITLAVPTADESFLPNFRRGDMVYLYQYRNGDEPDVRRSILYKASITEIHTAEITVALTNGQKNPDILKPQEPDDTSFYAIEHAGSGDSVGGAARSLHEFITSPIHRRDLILGQRPPQRAPSATLTKPYNAAYDDILLGAKQANDYYLLVGPPGTGKTSMAIRYIVEEELTRPDASILLMAYTNRAVDELCAMLDDAAIDYIRLGSEYSADPRCKPHLLAEEAKAHPRLDRMRDRLMSVRVITGTTSMLMSRPFIFDLRHFTLAVVDEASQILEPNIVGLLAAHRTTEHGQEACRIDKFILTGDHKQLPAVVRQDERASAVDSRALNDICLDNCCNSLFERLLRIERKAGRTEFIGVLRRHGRMHPEVADFPSREFYSDEQLQPVPLPHQRETALSYGNFHLAGRLDGMLREHRMIFIPSSPCRRPDLSDKVNTAEAATVADILRRVRIMTGERFTPEKSVGVIVPYRNQIAVIRKEIEKYGMPELEAVSIDTVERYQGSQRDVIIYSFTVQSEWQLDFLAGSCFTDNGHLIDRKLNVAMTRARLQMIMTGNEATLRTNPTFSRMIDYVKAKGGYLGEEEG